MITPTPRSGQIPTATPTGLSATPVSAIIPVSSNAANPYVSPAVTSIGVSLSGGSVAGVITVSDDSDNEDADVDIESVDNVTPVSKTITSGGQAQLPEVTKCVQEWPRVYPIYESESYNVFRLAKEVSNVENVDTCINCIYIIINFQTYLLKTL